MRAESRVDSLSRYQALAACKNRLKSVVRLFAVRFRHCVGSGAKSMDGGSSAVWNGQPIHATIARTKRECVQGLLRRLSAPDNAGKKAAGRPPLEHGDAVGLVRLSNRRRPFEWWQTPLVRHMKKRDGARSFESRYQVV